jgi:hypothetical protein
VPAVTVKVCKIYPPPPPPPPLFEEVSAPPPPPPASINKSIVVTLEGVTNEPVAVNS